MDLQILSANAFSQITQNPLLAIVLVILFITLVQVLLLSRRISKLTRGTTGASLENVIADLGAQTATLTKHASTTEEAINNLDERIQTAVRAISVRRFDPFQNAGGQQSFASALLNEHGDGVVLSGIHARDSVRVYAKNVHHFESERELSEDEAAAIVDAKKQLQ